MALQKDLCTELREELDEAPAQRVSAAMAYNASSIGDLLRLPHNGVVEPGTRVQI